MYEEDWTYIRNSIWGNRQQYLEGGNLVAGAWRWLAVARRR
jgi:hypothetical protein